MKNIILKSITISNFKGLRALKIDFTEGVTAIYGANASGKTTVFDAFLWLLFDKDSSNAKAFNIKPLAKDGKTAQKGVEPSVTALLLVDDKHIELKKVYTEKWAKKRGSVDAEFDGHETKYFVDQVPMLKKEYEKYIEEIVPESIFRLLTDVGYFNTKMHWQDRRKLLLEMCGDIADEDVIGNNEKLSPLASHLAKRSMEDYKKILAAGRSQINKEREELPVRIDEAYKSIVEGINETTEKEEIHTIEGRIAFLEAEKQIKQDADTLGDQIRKVDAAMYDLRSQNERYIAEEKAKFEQTNVVVFKQRNTLNAVLEKTQDTISFCDQKIKNTEEILNGLRAAYKQIKESEWMGDTVCPTCGQNLPEDTVQAGQEEFNIRKSEKLAANQTEGKAAAAELEKLKADVEGHRDTERRTIAALDQLAPEEEFVAKDMPDYETKMDDLMAQKQQLFIKQRQEEKAETATNNDTEIAELLAQKRIHESNLLKAENNKAQQKRITELEKQERELAKKLEETDQQIFLTEEFTKAKVSMLEEKINNTFKLASFKLFTEQVNGGLAECCEATYKGVPYADLNNAMRINLGIDVINALSRHYDVTAPVIIDNAESVTELTESAGQMIRLVVSKPDTQLRVEVEDAGKELRVEVA